MAAGLASLFSPQGRREAKAGSGDKEEGRGEGRQWGKLYFQSPGQEGETEDGTGRGGGQWGAQQRSRESRGSASCKGQREREREREKERERRLSGSMEAAQSDTSEHGGVGLSAYGCAYPYEGEGSEEGEGEADYRGGSLGRSMKEYEGYEQYESEEEEGAGLGYDEGDGAGSYGDSASVRRRGSGAGTPLSSVREWRSRGRGGRRDTRGHHGRGCWVCEPRGGTAVRGWRGEGETGVRTRAYPRPPFHTPFCPALPHSFFTPFSFVFTPPFCVETPVACPISSY